MAKRKMVSVMNVKTRFDGVNVSPRLLVVKENAQVYLEAAIQSFVADPPDNDFLRGYLSALNSMYEDLYMTGEQRKFNRMKTKGVA